jgi:hypothetical protein
MPLSTDMEMSSPGNDIRLEIRTLKFIFVPFGSASLSGERVHSTEEGSQDISTAGIRRFHRFLALARAQEGMVGMEGTEKPSAVPVEFEYRR